MQFTIKHFLKCSIIIRKRILVNSVLLEKYLFTICQTLLFIVYRLRRPIDGIHLLTFHMLYPSLINHFLLQRYSFLLL